MTNLRYQELRDAGPVITAEDAKRLEKFVPRISPMALAVRFAWWGRGWLQGTAK